jgi:prepilin-type N-terminal cleavage/methylation domain-containing protein
MVACRGSVICYSTMHARERFDARGFTLPELAVTLSIMSILSAIAMPKAADFIDGVRLRAAIVEIESLFESARHLAIARSEQVAVEIDAGTATVYVTAGADTLRAGRVGVEHGVKLSATRARMAYSAIGVGYGAANLSVFVRRNAVADTVVVSRLGRVRH